MRRIHAPAAPLALAVAAFSALALAACVSAPRPERVAPPNIVLMVVDDLGWQDLSVALAPEPTEFNRRYRTPNVERLAREGMRFSQAYAAAPVCTPTRSALLTGIAPARSHITYWTLHAGRDTSAAFPGLLAPKWNVDGVQPGVETLPGRLRDAGYRTIHVGKAHFGAVGTSGADPLSLGFDVNVAGHGAGGPGSYYGRENFSAAGRGGDRVWDVPGLERWHGQDLYLTEVLASCAREQLESAARSGAPFFLHFAPYAVHAPIQANPRYLANYADLDAREAAYATMVESYDAALGELLGALDELDLARNTLIVFTSDNGGLSAHARGGEPHTHNAPLRSGKGSCYEGGLRVPLIVRWPGVAAPGSRSEALVSSADLHETLRVAGARELQRSPHGDGLDLAPILRGARGDEQRALLWHQPHFWGVRGPGIWPFSALRRGRWKLIYRHADRGLELYDLETDLGESRDLSQQRPELVRELAHELGERLREMGAQMSIDAASGAPVPWPDAPLGERVDER